ncbi:MAG: type II secretion system protein GspD [Gemmataceae bacterium]
MARAKAVAWLGIVTGLVLTPAGLEAAPYSASLVSILGADTPAQSQVRPSRIRTALSSAIESYRKGEYEKAAPVFQQAKTGYDDLTPAEQQDLQSYMQLNANAMTARREASEQLRQAEKADKEGRMAVMPDLVKKIAINVDYLTAADKQKFQALNDKMLGRGMGSSPASTQGAIARAKLKQARTVLGKGDFAAAEQMAAEVAHMPVNYDPKEDTPAKVMDDIAKMKSDPKACLTAARVCLQKGDLDQAEHYAQTSEKTASSFSFTFSSDSPSKVLHDVKNARLAQTKTGAGSSAFELKVAKTGPAPVKDPMARQTEGASVPSAKSDSKSEEARRLVKEGREAFNKNELDKATKLCDQAAALNANLPFYEDHPEKLKADIVKKRSQNAAANLAGSKEDPHELLKKGRELCKVGRFDEALAYGQKAKASNTHWGLFDDSPDSLLQDVEKARAKHDQEESVKVLTDARKLFEKGDLESATQATYRAEKLHGPYSIWDMGDRPQKLRGEIETARAKGVKSTVPNVPGGVARNDKRGSTKSDISNDDVRAAQARQMLADARMALKAGSIDQAAKLANDAKSLKVAAYKPGDDTPDKVLMDIQQARVAKTGNTRPASNPSMALESATDSKKQAVQLLGQAKQYQQQGNLVLARQKTVEAQMLRASFGPEESSPEQLLLQLASLAHHRIDGLMVDADECMRNAGSNPQMYTKADKDLREAKQLASCYGLDTLPIDSKLGFMRQVASNGAKVPAPTVYPTVEQTTASNSQEGKGLEILQRARLELKRGDTASARRMAIDAYQGTYGVQKQAAEVMRSIDAEEEGQRRLTASRTFDAAKAAYLRQDYVHAARILQSVDMRTLDTARQSRYKEMINSAELNPYLASDVAVAKAPATTGGLRQVNNTEVAKTSLNDQSGDYQAQYNALQDIKFQQMRAKGLEIQREAAEHFKNGETDQALDLLQGYLAALPGAQLDPEWVTRLRRPVEARLTQYKTLKTQRDQEKERAVALGNNSDHRSKAFLAEQNKEKKVAELIKEFNDLYKHGQYQEAETKAMLAHEMDPDNAMTAAAIKLAQLGGGKDRANKAKSSREDIFEKGMNDSETEGAYVDLKDPLHIDKDRLNIALHRKNEGSLPVSPKKKASELEIEHKLQTPVNLNFNETPLRTVINDLRTWQGINIVLDDAALKEGYVSLDQPITLQLENVSLKSALKLLLDKVHLTYVVEDEVLKITTEAHSRGQMVTVVYPVADLVIPIPNFDGSNNSLMRSIEESQNPTNSMNSSGPSASPYVPPFSLGGGSSVSNQNSSGGFATTRGQPQAMKNNPKYTMEDTLMNLITNTVSPRTWDRQGGQGSIDYFPMTLALAINQTPDIQDQIAELLTALRRLQDQEVAIEVKFITIAEGFFERIGVDFNINLPTKVKPNVQAQLTSQQFQAPGQVNAFEPTNTIIGLTPAGTFTTDLDIPLKASSFGMALPPFGGFPSIPGANGGISMGLAFLSDVQVFLFMEAAQGDQRTNVMQAPKLTLFNGQTATLQVSDQQFFVTNVNIQAANGQLTFIPQNQNFATGTFLTVQATISADRRFVRLNVTPQITNLASAVVPLFPIVTPIQVFFEGGFSGPTVNFTQFIQQPVFNTITVNTTVAVPDGGTVLMGGLKRLSEGRNEFGPPVLSKIPYINRLFKNTGYGRETESLMIMVTPRIIINEEEEIKQTGVVSTPQQQ